MSMSVINAPWWVAQKSVFYPPIELHGHRGSVWRVVTCVPLITDFMGRVYMHFYAYEYEVQNVAILHDARPARAAAGALISQASQLVLVESGLPNLCSSATPVLPELGGDDMRKDPSLGSSTAPSRSTNTFIRDNRCSSRRRSPPNLVFFRPSRGGKKKKPKPHTVSGWRSRPRAR
jgi:hypothetical protein